MRFLSCALMCAIIGLGYAQDSVGGTTLGPDRQILNPGGTWHYEWIQPQNHHGELTVTLNVTSGQASLFLKKGKRPIHKIFDYSAAGSGPQTIRVTNTSKVPLTTEPWYIGVYSRRPATFTITKQSKAIAAEFPGNGATPFARGTTFRVWAPNAQSANIAGQFNSWSTTATPMISEGNGWYSIDYRNANPGQQYKFVLKRNGSTIWKNDPWARQLTNSIGNSVIHNRNYAWQTNNFTTPSWENMVIYEMHVGTFNDSPGGSPGTFQAAINRLNHLQQLGVNCVHVMPVQEFPGDFSWGYNPSHQFSVESAYGGPDMLKKFVDEANARGIAVILDVIHNHYGPGDLDLWRFDGWSSGTYGGVFFYNDSRAVTPWGDTRPDYGRQEVRQFIRDNQMMWANEYRVSGFRWDSTVNMRRTNLGDNPDGWSLLQLLNNDLDASQPWKINIAEDLQSDSWVTRATNIGGAGFDAQWANYVHTLRAALSSGDDNARNMNDVAGALNERFNGDAFERVIYTESHDENANGKQRMPSTIDPGDPDSYWAQKRSTLGAAITMTAPGIPMLFQGQEILEDGWFSDTDPVDWNKLTTYAGIHNLYKDLIKLRRNLTGKSRGLSGQGMNLHHLNNTGKVIAYHRWHNGGSNDDVVVVANFRNQTWTDYRVGLPRAGGWSVAFNSDWNGYSSLFGNQLSPNFTADAIAYDGLSHSGKVNLAPYSVIILTKD